MIKLRPYQHEAIAAFNGAVAGGQNNNIVVLPTGTGKTLTALALAKQRGGRCLWLAHREELITQPLKALKTVWPEVMAGVVKADRNEWARSFVFASTATAWRPGRREKLKDFDLVIVDEAHHSAARSYKLILEQVGCLNYDPSSEVWSPASDGPPLLGLTATPGRTDLLRLDNVFSGICYTLQLRTAVEAGYLVDVEMVQRPIKVNLDAVGKNSSGDFKPGELDIALLEAGIVDDVANAVHDLARDRKTIIFTVSVNQAEQIAERLRGMGLRASHVSGKTPTEQRRKRLAQFATGEISHMVNCMVLCLDEQTEILTEDGWTGIDEMTDNHRVANWENGHVYFEEPHEVVRRPRGPDESMYVLETRTRSIRVTGRHRMIHRAQGAAKWRKSPVDDIAGKGHQLPTCGSAGRLGCEPDQPAPRTAAERRRAVAANAYNLRKNNGFGFDDSVAEAQARFDRRASLRRTTPRELSIAECEFIGFWLGDGSVSQLQSGGIEYTVVQAKRYHHIIAWFDDVLAVCDFDFVRREPTAGIPRVLWSFGRGTGGGTQERRGLFSVEPYLNKDGTHLFNSLDGSQFQALLRGFWYADGNHGDAERGMPDNYLISNCSKMLLDRLQSIAVVRGMSASVTKGSKPRKDHHRQLWVLGIQAKNYHQMSAAKPHYSIQREDKPWSPERVWCVKTTTKNIITRRNGRVTVMGNTEGFDEPTVECIIMARPTTSKSLFVQCVGRGLRIAPNKTDCLLIDMVGTTTRHNLVQAPVIFGIDGEEDDTTEPIERSPDEEIKLSHRQSLLISQVKGVAPVARSALKWVPSKNGSFALDCGEGGTVRMLTVGEGDWLVDVVHRRGSRGVEPLTMSPISLELAQGIAEDYVRRAGAVYLTSRSSKWRDDRPTSAQLSSLVRNKILVHSEMTRGEASDLITRANASNWRNDPATDKQVSALRRMGALGDKPLTKGEAGRLLAQAKR